MKDLPQPLKSVAISLLFGLDTNEAALCSEFQTKFAAFLLRFLGRPTSLECFEIAHFQEEIRRLVYDEGQRRLIIGATSGAFIVRRNTRSECQ